MTTEKPTILLVDDDEPTRYSTRRALKQLAVRGQVLEAADGQEAMQLVEAHCADCDDDQSLLVLLDLNMPVMDGLAFLEHQMQLPQRCRQLTTVIVVSGTPSAEEQRRAQQLAVAVVPKPLASPGLAELLRQHMPRLLPEPPAAQA